MSIRRYYACDYCGDIESGLYSEKISENHVSKWDTSLVDLRKQLISREWTFTQKGVFCPSCKDISPEQGD